MNKKILWILGGILSVQASAASLHVGSIIVRSAAEAENHRIHDLDILQGRSRNFCYMGNPYDIKKLVEEILAKNPDGGVRITGSSVVVRGKIVHVEADYYGDGDNGSGHTNLKIEKCQ